MRRTITTLHVILAGFFFPLAVMFALTGGLYTLGIKGAFVERTVPVAVTAIPGDDLSAWITLAESTLAQEGIDVPSGGAGLKKAGTSKELEWTGVTRDVVLRPTTDSSQMELVIKETTPWRHVVQLHKAKGSGTAKAISVAWAAGLVLLMLSGLILAFSVPAFRRLAVPSILAGSATFVAYLLLG